MMSSASNVYTSYFTIWLCIVSILALLDQIDMERNVHDLSVASPGFSIELKTHKAKSLIDSIDMRQCLQGR